MTAPRQRIRAEHTHGEASLCAGCVDADEVGCSWHPGRFCVRDGGPTAFAAVEPIKAWRTRVVDGQIYIDQP